MPLPWSALTGLPILNGPLTHGCEDLPWATMVWGLQPWNVALLRRSFLTLLLAKKHDQTKQRSRLLWFACSAGTWRSYEDLLLTLLLVRKQDQRIREVVFRSLLTTLALERRQRSLLANPLDSDSSNMPPGRGSAGRRAAAGFPQALPTWSSAR